MSIRLSLVSLLFASQLLAQSPYLDDNADAIESFLERHFADGNAGMVIGLIDKHGTRVFSAGRLDNGTDALVNGDTVFELGSVTKVFTSLLLPIAVQRGEVLLDDPAAKFLPEDIRVPARGGQQISLLNLAVQDSGLPWHPPQHEELLDFKSGKPNYKALQKAASQFSRDDLYELLQAYELPQKPGERFQYSNVGMALLGHVLERAAGTPYEALVVDRICRPLDMRDTRFDLSDAQRGRLAHGHMADDTKSDFWDFDAMQPAGGLLSTANDMLKFIGANLGHVSSDLTPLMQQTHVSRHTGSKQFGRTAMPWVDNGVYNPPGSILLGHAGGGVGTIAFVAFDAANKHGAVVLTNQVKIQPSPVGWTLVQKMPFTPGNTAFAVREVVGLGVVLKKDSPADELRISRVFPESPAGEANITTADIITKIDDNQIDRQELNECYQLLAGDLGDSVRLVLSDLDGKSRTVTLTHRRFLTSS